MSASLSLRATVFSARVLIGTSIRRQIPFIIRSSAPASPLLPVQLLGVKISGRLLEVSGIHVPLLFLSLRVPFERGMPALLCSRTRSKADMNSPSRKPLPVACLLLLSRSRVSSVGGLAMRRHQRFGDMRTPCLCLEALPAAARPLECDFSAIHVSTASL